MKRVTHPATASACKQATKYDACIMAKDLAMVCLHEVNVNCILAHSHHRRALYIELGSMHGAFEQIQQLMMHGKIVPQKEQSSMPKLFP